MSPKRGVVGQWTLVGVVLYGDGVMQPEASVCHLRRGFGIHLGMNTHKLFSLALAWLLALLVSCDRSPNSSESGSGRLFVVSLQTLNNPCFLEINEGLKKVIEARGDRLVTLDAQFNSTRQHDELVDLLPQHPATIFINPVNWEAVKGTLIEAKRQKVPVVIVDAPVSDPDLVLCQVASDNVEAGRLAGEALASVRPEAKVAILHLSLNKACIDRVSGFKSAVAKHPGMSILDIQEGKGTTETARPVMAELLGRFPNLDAVFAVNDPTALGCISAIESAGRSGRLTVVSVDGSREGALAIQAGKLHCSVVQFPKEIGRIAAEKAYDHLSGKPVPKDVKVPVKLATKETVGDLLKTQ